MKRTWLGSIGVVTAVVGLGAISVAAQAPAAKAKAAGTAKSWTMPRTPEGHPDISGIWSHNAATPLERPKELADRATLTEDELASLKAHASELFNGETDAAFGDSVFLAALRSAKGDKSFKSTDTTGNYNHFWLVDRQFDNRTSLVSDPADGRIPALLPAYEKKKAEQNAFTKAHQYEAPENIALGLRCITGNVPMIGAGYNNYYQIAQAADFVAVNMEMRHDTRMVPLDGRKHPSQAIKNWLGTPSGRWEGDTLVVETRNFKDDAAFRIDGDENMHLTERFSRVGPDTLKYEVTIDDPTVYTKPWTATLFMKKETKDQIYEFACHEGNEAMFGTLHGERTLERDAAAGAKKGSR